MKKFQNIKKMKQNKENFSSYFLLISLILLWQILSILSIIPEFMLPSPISVLKAFKEDFFILIRHTKVTLTEALLGLFFSIIIAYIFAFLMDRYRFIKKNIYPIIILTQTVPTIAIAPLLVLWFGYDMLPKIILIVITCFFPLTIGLLNGFTAIDNDVLNLMKSMGASKNQIFRYVKFPSSLDYFFSGLKISTSYAIVGAVISEWLGGINGLGVYMVRVKKSYNFDKMFAVIFLVSLISLLLMKLIDTLHKRFSPLKNFNK